MIGCKAKHFESCASTNDEAALWARDRRNPAPHGAVVSSDCQTQGRGRLGKGWHSPGGKNLYFSCILRPAIELPKIPAITLCAGLAICQVMNEKNIRASIKWPNDIWVGSKKLAGVLTEMSTREKKLEYVIVGVGINVNSTEFPPELSATSMKIETGEEQVRSQVLGSVLFALDEWVTQFCEKGVSALHAAFEKNSLLSGQDVLAKVGGKMVRGRVKNLGEDGSLIIVDKEQTSHHVLAGEIQLLTETI